jgi:hypothetical protein
MPEHARIYQPPKNAMQSGWAGTGQWRLEYLPQKHSRPDALMGWDGGGDTQTQVRLHFATQAEAIAYAERLGLSYEVEAPVVRQVKPKAYADNFRYGRTDNWTH